MSEQPHPSPQVQGELQPSSEQAEGSGSGMKRAVMTAAGGALAIKGLQQRSLLGSVMTLAGGYLAYRGIRGTSPSIPAGKLTEALPSGGGEVSAEEAQTEVERSITIDAPAEELHEYWKNPEQLSKILGQYVEISESSEERLHWNVEIPLDDFPLNQLPFDRLPISRSTIPDTYEWETEFVEDSPGEVLRWESVEGTRLPSELELTFEEAPGDRGTEVTLRAEFHPPGGSMGARAMERLGFAIEPIVGTSLRRFKSLAETGEIPTLVGNPSARGLGDLA